MSLKKWPMSQSIQRNIRQLFALQMNYFDPTIKQSYLSSQHVLKSLRFITSLSLKDGNFLHF